MGKMDVLREKEDHVRSETNASTLSLKNMPNQIAEIASALEQGRAQTGRFQERVNAQVAQAIHLITQVQNRLGEITPTTQTTFSEKELLPPPQFWQSLKKNLAQSAREIEMLRKVSREISNATSRLLNWNFGQIVTLIILVILLAGNLILGGITRYRETLVPINDISKLIQEVNELRGKNKKWERFYQSLDPQGRKWIEEWWEANP